MKNNIAGWFEIPVNDMERAMAFYQEVLGITLQRMKLQNIDMALFPYVENGLGTAGALVCNPEFYTPSENGILLYLTTPSGDVSNELARVDAAGGKVILPKKMVSPEHGYMGMFIDTEGNRIAIHGHQ